MVPEPVITPSAASSLSAHAEILAVVLDKQIVLVERAFIEQRSNPLPCGHLAAGLLLADGLVAAAF